MSILFILLILTGTTLALDRRCDVNETSLVLNTLSPSCYSTVGECDTSRSGFPASVTALFPNVTHWANCTDCFYVASEDRQVCIPGIEFPCTLAEQLTKCGRKSSNCYKTLLKSGNITYTASCAYPGNYTGFARRCTARETLAACSSDREKCRVRCSNETLDSNCVLEYICPFSNTTFVSYNKNPSWESCSLAESNQKCPQAQRSGGCTKRGCTYSDYFNVSYCDRYIVSTCEPQNCTTAQQLVYCGQNTHLCQLTCDQTSCSNTKNCSHTTSLEVRRCNHDEMRATCTDQIDNCRVVLSPNGTISIQAYCSPSLGWSSFMSNGTLHPAGTTHCGSEYNATLYPAYWNAGATVLCETGRITGLATRNCRLQSACAYNDTTPAEQLAETGGFYNGRCRKLNGVITCFDSSWWKTVSPHRLCTPEELATTCAAVKTDCRKVCTDTDFTVGCQLQFICPGTPAQSFWTSAHYSSSRSCTDSEANLTCAAVSTDCKYETSTGTLSAYCPWSSRAQWTTNFVNSGYIDCTPSESLDFCGPSYNHTCARWNCSYNSVTGYQNCTNYTSSCHVTQCSAEESLSVCGYYTHECTKWCPSPTSCVAVSCGFPSSDPTVQNCTSSQFQSSCARRSGLCRVRNGLVESVSPFSLWWNTSCVSFTGESTCNDLQSASFCGQQWSSDAGKDSCTTGMCSYSNSEGFTCSAAKNHTCVCPSSYAVADLPCESSWGLRQCLAGDYNLDPINYCGTFGTSCLLNCTGAQNQYNCDAIVSGGQTCTCTNQTKYGWFNNLQCNAIKKTCDHYGFFACGKYAQYCDLFVTNEDLTYTPSLNGNIVCSCLGGTYGGVNACNSTSRSIRKCDSAETLANCGIFGVNCTYDNATDVFFPGSCECNTTSSFLFNKTCHAKPNTFRTCTKAENDTCTFLSDGGCYALCSADDNCQVNRSTCYISEPRYIDCPLNITWRYCGSPGSVSSCKMWAYYDRDTGMYNYTYDTQSITCNCNDAGFDTDFKESWEILLPTLYGRPCFSQADINLNCDTNYTQQLCGSYSGPSDPSIDAFTENEHVCKRNAYTGLVQPLTCPSTFSVRSCTDEEFYSFCPLSSHESCQVACSGSDCRLYGKCATYRNCEVQEIASYCGEFSTSCEVLVSSTTTLKPGSCTYLCPTYRTGSSCETSTLFPGSCSAQSAELCGPANHTSSCVFDGLSSRPICTCTSTHGSVSNVVSGYVGSPGGLPCAGSTFTCTSNEVVTYTGSYGVNCTIMCTPQRTLCCLESYHCMPNGTTKYDPLVPLDSYKRNPASFWPVVDLPCGQTWRVVNTTNSTAFCGQYSASVIVNETLGASGQVVTRVAIAGTCVCSAGWKVGLTGICNNQFETLPCTDIQEDYLDFIGYCPYADQCKVQCLNGTCFSYAPNRCFDTTYLMPCSYSFRNSTCGYTSTNCMTNCTASRTIPPTITCNDDNQQCTCTNKQGWNRYCYDIVEITDLYEAKTRCGPGAIGMSKRCYNANCSDTEIHECYCSQPFSTNTTDHPKHCGYVFTGDACDISSIAEGSPDVLQGVAGFAACGVFTESSYRICLNSSGYECSTACICREDTGDLLGIPCFGYDRPGNQWECDEGCPVLPVTSCTVRASYDNTVYDVIHSSCVVNYNLPALDGYLPDGVTAKSVCTDAIKLANCGPIAGVSACYMYQVNSTFIPGTCVCNPAVSQTDTQVRFGYPCVPWFEQYRDCTVDEATGCGTKYVAACRMKHVFTPVDLSVAITSRVGNEPAYRYTTNSLYLTSRYYLECSCHSYYDGQVQPAWSSSFQPANVLWPNLRWVPKCDHQAFLNLQVSLYGYCPTNSFSASLSAKVCNARGACGTTLSSSCLATTEGYNRYHGMYSMIRGSFENPNAWPGTFAWQGKSNEWQFQCPCSTAPRYRSCTSPGCSGCTCGWDPACCVSSCTKPACNKGCFGPITQSSGNFTSGTCTNANDCTCGNDFSGPVFNSFGACYSESYSNCGTQNCYYEKVTDELKSSTSFPSDVNLYGPDCFKTTTFVNIFGDSRSNWSPATWKGGHFISTKSVTIAARMSFADLHSQRPSTGIPPFMISNWTMPRTVTRKVRALNMAVNTDCSILIAANNSITYSGDCDVYDNWAIVTPTALPLANSVRLNTLTSRSSEYSVSGTRSQYYYYDDWVKFLRSWKVNSQFPGQGTDTFVYQSLPCGANACTCNSLFSGIDCGVRNCAQPTWTSAVVYSLGSSCHMYFIGTGCDNNGQRCTLLTGDYTGFTWTGRQGCVNGVYDVYGSTGRCICDVGWSDRAFGATWAWNPIPNLATGVITMSESACTKTKCANSCQNGGTCSDWGPDRLGLCTCPFPYTGYRCERFCEPAAGNGLVCSGNGYCSVDQDCVNTINGLVFGGSVSTYGSYKCNKCTCYEDTNYYWTGADCSIPVMKQTCLNGGVAVGLSGFSNSSLVVCSCPPEWSGLRCELSTCPVINGEICNGKGVCVAGKCRQLINSLFQCALDTTYTGCGCEYDMKSYCQQPGTSRICSGELITDQYTGRQRAACNFEYTGALTTMECVCPPSRTGSFCQLSTCDPPENPCNGQRCYYDYDDEESKCDCGVFGATIDTRLRIGDLCQYDVTDECGFNSGGQLTECAGGGTCVNNTGTFSCSCFEGNTGVKCEIQDCGVPCVWGTCRRIPNTLSSRCECFNDDVYSKNTGLGIESCTYSQCGNALPTADGTACVCNDTSKVPKSCSVNICPSAGGSLCGISPAFDSPFGYVGDTVYKQCLNGRCICGWPYTQANNASVCVSICNVNNTVSAAYKVVSVGGRARLALDYCVCKPGYTSSSRCVSEYCQNQGTFLNNGTCSCPRYVHGGDDCSQSRCVQGSIDGSGEACTCNTGWTGLLCDIEIPQDPPEPEPEACSNGGSGEVPDCTCTLPWLLNTETGDCTNHNCGPNGSPQLTTCTCSSPYQLNGILMRCELPCSIHGVFDLETQLCECDPNYEGLYCGSFVPDVIQNNTNSTSPPVPPPVTPVVSDDSNDDIIGIPQMWFITTFSSVGGVALVAIAYVLYKHYVKGTHQSKSHGKHGRHRKTEAEKEAIEKKKAEDDAERVRQRRERKKKEAGDKKKEKADNKEKKKKKKHKTHH